MNPLQEHLHRILTDLTVSVRALKADERKHDDEQPHDPADPDQLALFPLSWLD